MHSIIGQGRVEEILGSKPEERRQLLEEAAGLGRFKRRKHRAELKLTRVGIQVERARDVEAEVKKRLRPLALQATAAERAEKLRGEIASLRARVAELDLAELRERLQDGDGRRTAAVLARRHADEKLDSLLEERRRAEEELADAAGRREQATALLYRLRSGRERLELRRESAQSLLDTLRAELARPRRVLDARVRAERESLREQARVAGERLQTLERALAEREGLPPAARALAEEGERLALSLLDVDPGNERAVAAALGHRAAGLVADDARSALALAERARAAGLGNVVVLTRPPAEVVAELPVVPKEQLLQSQVPAVTPEGFGYDPRRGEVWFAGRGGRSRLARARGAPPRARGRGRGLDARVAAPIPEDAYSATRDPLTVTLARLSAQLVETLEGVTDDRHEAPLRARADAGAQRTTGLADELRRLGAAEVDARRAASEAGERLSAVDVERARIEAELDEAQRRLDAAAAEPAEGDDRDELAERIERLERRPESLGQVNPLAKQEYDQEKERLVELSAQREDLEASLAELEKLRDDLGRTVEERFAETFAAVQANFAEVAATLFPGGEGRLRLTDPDEEDEQPGIEVELRPAGKKVTRLSLLSGGEKALGAISFLFALFLARPCPFYLLDEVEAALDDTNIGRFVELLRRYSDRRSSSSSRTRRGRWKAADILYGVTMGADGVSQIVSRRLPREEAAVA
jgi:chromosome segregation protein